MKLSQDNNFLKSIVEAGTDAFQNLYIVEFQGDTIGDSVAEALKVRCQDISIPEPTQDTYPVTYLTATIDRPAAKVKLTRELKFSFRVDANYVAYQALLKNQSEFLDITQHAVATDLEALMNKMFNVRVSAITEPLTSESTPVMELLASFSKCWVSAVTPIEFSPETSKPAVVSVTVKFLYMKNTVEESK